jgi:predicted dehydrogenase
MQTKPFKLGILSTANIAKQFADGLRQSQSVTISAVASRSAAPAQAFAKAHQIATHYASYEQLLADSSIEAVYIPLPNHMHAQWAIKAMQAGKHVLCEKPLCLGLKEAKAMFSAADQHGVMLLEAYPYWFQPQTFALVDLLAEKAIGDIIGMQANFSFSLLRHAGNIRTSQAAGGGALLDVGSYCVSLTRLVMGQAPLRVSATPVWTVGGVALGVDIAMLATLEFAGGRTAQISCAMNRAFERKATIMGSAGTIETHYLNHTSAQDAPLRLWRGVVNDGPAGVIPTATGDGFRYTAEAFAGAVRSGNHAAINRARDASLDIARTLEAIASSARSGKAVVV